MTGCASEVTLLCRGYRTKRHITHILKYQLQNDIWCIFVFLNARKHKLVTFLAVFMSSGKKHQIHTTNNTFPEYYGFIFHISVDFIQTH